MMDGSPPASACAAVKGMAERTRADPPLKKRIGEDIMNNLDRAHARRALPMNHAAKSVRFRMASITGSEVGRRSCWRGWRRGKPAANRYFCDARAEQRRLDRAWSPDRSAKIRPVESSAKSGEGAWMSRQFLRGHFLFRVAVLEIGSSSCRERVCLYVGILVVAVTLKQTIMY